MRGFAPFLIVLCAVVAASDAIAEEADDTDFFGPTSVKGQLAEDRKIARATERQTPIQGWKACLKKRAGLDLGLDFTVLSQRLDESAGADWATGSIFRVYGTWDLVCRGGKDTGSLVFKFENRTAWSDVPPLNLGFETGYIGVTGPPFSDFGWGVTNFFWRQKLAGGRVTLLAGRIDATDFLDIYGLINPWSGFQNLAFLTSPTIAAPNQGLGAAAGVMLSKNVYAIAGIEDANGQADKFGFETIDKGEFFKHAELGWTSAQDRIYLDNVHVTGWHVDEREDAGVEESWGVAFSAAFFLCDRWMPFLRGGFSEGDAAVYDRSISAGVGYYRKGRGDLAAIGFNVGRPNGFDDWDQYTLEAFYRFQFAPQLALTPSVQLFGNPAASDEDLVVLLGLRMRIAL